MTCRGFSISLLLLVAAGCTAAPQTVSSSPPSQSSEPKAIVFAVDGAGGFYGFSHSMKQFVQGDAVPLHVHTFDWSHGKRRIFADQYDRGHARAEGERLAQEILAY